MELAKDPGLEARQSGQSGQRHWLSFTAKKRFKGLPALWPAPDHVFASVLFAEKKEYSCRAGIPAEPLA